MAGLNIAKCTLVFGQGQVGWTENYFLDAPSANLQPEAVKLYNLAAKRILLSGSQTYISALKLSNESILRDSRTVFYGAIPATPFQGTSTEDSDFPDTALLFKRHNVTRSSTSSLFLRGIWDGLVTQGGVFVPNPGWTALYNSYVSQLLSDAWGFVGRDPATLPRQPITAVAQAGTGQINLTVNAPIFGVGQINTKAKIFVSGVAGAAIVNGPQVVNVTSVTTAQTVKRIPMFPYLGGGIMTVNTPKFFLIGAAFYSRAVERKVGRPLFLSRGRAPNRVLS